MVASDSDDEDTFVLIGDPLKPYEEDEPVKKKYNLEDQKVKDDQGRQRFHGAFTGGFSAGYFNTVGSKEGWTPSTFVSSREKRSGEVGQKPEDFMDTEDLGEYGIAPRQVKATEDYGTTQGPSRKRPVASDGIFAGTAPLAELIKPTRQTIGVRLLRKLGWKDGQGVGPRTRKKKRTKQTASHKVYGCSLPTPDGAQSSSSDDDVGHMTSQDVTFAPKDVNPIVFRPKDDLHGLGYSGITPGGAPDPSQIFEERSGRQGRQGNKGMRGHAFGIGALEDNDDYDVYNTATDMSRYDTVLGGPDNSGTHGWTAPSNKGGGAHRDYADVILEGFQLMCTQQKPQMVYPPPPLPRQFKPFHVFTTEETAAITAAQQIPKKFSLGWKKLDAADRREALGEKPDIKSVFDLVSDKSQQHMKSCQMEPPAKAASSAQDEGSRSSTAEGSRSFTDKPKVTEVKKPDDLADRTKAALLAGITNRFQSAGTEMISPSSSSDHVTTPAPPAVAEEAAPLYKGRNLFQPFAKNPDKQERYEKFVAAKKSGNKDEYCALTGHMTEWERGREQEEFSRSADLYRPMSSLMATRFTLAKFADDEKVTVNKEEGGAVSEQAKAASMKMYGRLTRDIFDWYPDKLLCKRFNVPNPYPDSTIVGLPKVKRDKFSVFNFLSFPGQEVSEPDNSAGDQAKETPTESHDDTGSHRKKLGQQGKPLAILASLDLRRPSDKSGVKEKPDETTASGVGPITVTERHDNDSSEKDGLDTVSSDRPPMDIFKAVFGDSDGDDDKSSSSEDNDDQPEEHVSSTTAENHSTKPTQQVQGIFGTTQASAKGGDNNNPFSRLFGADQDMNVINSRKSPMLESANVTGVDVGVVVSPRTDGSDSDREIQQRLGFHTVDGKTDRETPSVGDAYGPALPPSLGHGTPLNITKGQSSVQPDRKDQHKKKKKHKEKSKHKTKKSKHKKHKEKHKKKKKRKEVIAISSGSSDEADSDDSSSSTSINKEELLLQKLRSIGKRATAADYM